MRNYTLILFILFFTKICYGTGQVPDFLIYKGDTLAIFTNPLEKYFDQTGKRELIDFVGCGSTACWRGYKAIWELKGDDLYLIKITSCHNNCGLEIKNADLKKMFGQDIIFAEWFSGNIVAPKGKLINYIHMGYASLYEKEDIFSFKKGKLIGKKTYQNYIDLENGVSRTDNDTVPKILLKEISKHNWNELSSKNCSDEYIVTIGKKGTVSKVEFVSNDENKWDDFWYRISHHKCTRTFKKKLSDLQFDLIKRKGKPIEEKYRIDLFELSSSYDNEGNKLKK